jgi:hypothetical protein
MRTLYLLLASIAFFFSNCKNDPKRPEQAKTESDLPADFQDFYQKFHADSAYQMAHIQWPLKGETSEPIDSIQHRKVLVSWEPATWRLFQTPDFGSGDFKRELEMVGDVLVVERIRYKAANYGVERHFFKNDQDEWELIFYADMQETH